MIDLILGGLSVLPKIPALWDKVAGIFGKKVPKSVKAAGDLATEVTKMISSDQAPPEQLMALKMAIMEHEEVIKKLQLEEKRLYLENEQQKRDTQVKLWANEAASNDSYVKQTRPKILREMWNFVKYYTLLCLAAVLLLKWAKVNDTQIVMEWIKYSGGFLYGTFSAAFLGYTTARTVDKKNPDFKNGDGILPKIMNQFIK